MTKWIFGIFIILDCVYQLFADSKSIGWAVYYDILHYSTLLSISIYFMLNSFNKLYHIFTAYFIIVIAAFIYDYLFNIQEYGVKHSHPVFYSSLIILLILIIFISWTKLKKAGKL